jgi:hypothetical protein
VGFCGQGVSNSVILRGLVAIAGIVSASVVPDTYYRTKLDMAAVEAEQIPVAKLGEWLSQQHLKHLRTLLGERKYDHILKKYKNGHDLRDGTRPRWPAGRAAQGQPGYAEGGILPPGDGGFPPGVPTSR